jgi:hypothetical protein
VIIALAWLLGCGAPEPAPAPSDPPPPPPAAPAPSAPAQAGAAPEVAFVVPARSVASPLAQPTSAEIDGAKAILRPVVERYGLDPLNPWAVSHAILALGAEVELPGKGDAIDYLFAEYAVPVEVGGEGLVEFPPSRGEIRIEPHTDLLLKAMVERGVAPDRQVRVRGRAYPISSLYRYSLWSTWVDGEQTSAGTYNDMPWTLQALAAWAPPGLSWTASGGHAMTMDGLTSAVVGKLAAETAFLRRGMSQGVRVEKRGQGIFAYTCGGAHFVQGPAFAVARGFGSEEDRKVIASQAAEYLYRLGVELPQVDAAMQQHPEYGLVLITQRMKFLGHLVETVHKLAALGFVAPGPEVDATLRQAEAELVATVGAIERNGVFGKLDAIRASDEQQYLDLVGDAAHALRALDLATGAPVAY